MDALGFTGSVHGGDNSVLGGEFMWGGYGVVAAAAPTNQYVELIWRGKSDFHGTLACHLAPGASWATTNRLACSVQVTKAYRQRVDRGMDESGRFPEDRIDLGRSRKGRL